MSLSNLDLLFENNSIQYYEENIDTEIEKMTKELIYLENEGKQLDSLISESGLFK